MEARGISAKGWEGKSPPSDGREEVSPGEPVPPLLVQPPAAVEDGGHAGAGVGDFHLVHQPARAVAAAVVFHAHFAQLAQLQRLQEEAVGAAPLEEVAHFLLQLPFARVPVGPEDGHEDIGVGACPWLIARRHNDLVLDRHQALDLAGKALRRLGDLEYLEVLPLPLERDEAVTIEEVPRGEGGGSVDTSRGSHPPPEPLVHK